MKRVAHWTVVAVVAMLTAFASVMPDEDWPFAAIVSAGAAGERAGLAPEALMRRTPRRGIAWVLWGLGLLLAAATITLSIGGEPGPLLVALWIVPFIAFSTVGTLLASRRGHVIGWMFLGFGVLNLTGTTGDAWSQSALGPLPGVEYAAWLQHWTVQSPAVFALLAFVLLLFPDGHLPSRRWRWPAKIAAAATALFTVLIAFKPGQLAESEYHNPVAVETLDWIWRFAEFPLGVIVMLAAPTAAVGFVLRFRRSRGVERLQLKWFALAAGVLGVIVALAPVVWALPSLWWLWPILFVIGLTSLPAAAGTAILRYRLYDIDRVISRTVSYAILTAALGGVFALVVLVPTGIGRTNTPDWVIALGTLATVALFRPLRHRLQSAVDWRFNRARYDATRTIEAFASHLREHVDIEALTANLLELVQTTMQPTTVSVWIRDDAHRS